MGLRLINKNTAKARSIKITDKKIRRLLSVTIFTYTNGCTKAIFNEVEVLRVNMCNKFQVGHYKIYALEESSHWKERGSDRQLQ